MCSIASLFIVLKKNTKKHIVDSNVAINELKRSVAAFREKYAKSSVT
jgi:hypothetical protein